MSPPSQRPEAANANPVAARVDGRDSPVAARTEADKGRQAAARRVGGRGRQAEAREAIRYALSFLSAYYETKCLI